MPQYGKSKMAANMASGIMKTAHNFLTIWHSTNNFGIYPMVLGVEDVLMPQYGKSKNHKTAITFGIYHMVLWVKESIETLIKMVWCIISVNPRWTLFQTGKLAQQTQQTWSLIDERKEVKNKLLNAKSPRLKERLRREYSAKDKQVKSHARNDKRRFTENLATKGV